MSIRRLLALSSVALAAAPVAAPANPPALSPLESIERFHQAMFEADAATAESLLHAEYHGISLQGPRDHRHIYVETRAKAVSDIAKLNRGDWEVRFLKTSTQIDPNGMAHVWARYVFYFKSKAQHCGFESYGLYREGTGWKIISFADTDNPLGSQGVEEVCPEG